MTGTREQFETKGILEIVYEPTDAGLRDVQQLRRTGDRATAHGRAKGL